MMKTTMHCEFLPDVLPDPDELSTPLGILAVLSGLEGRSAHAAFARTNTHTSITQYLGHNLLQSAAYKSCQIYGSLAPCEDPYVIVVAGDRRPFTLMHQRDKAILMHMAGQMAYGLTHYAQRGAKTPITITDTPNATPCLIKPFGFDKHITISS